MSEIAIHARGLTKVYRLYAKPQHRFLDMFGLLRGGKRAYSEHAAVTGVNLEIRRGERVAIIGRNGAGKSTLLKLISNVIEPTSGSIDVQGEARALLQIGSGFHPDFTGRENVYAYLAHIGIIGPAADRLFTEVLDFAELEEYIDQPLKTFSTGMAVRLMFAASTAVTPDILVLDEVLSVGDAYFSHKSFERISELCEASGTTLLLVSHDIYTAAKICPRMIWLDHGEVVMDERSAVVIKAYEDSIREQEEERLRKRKRKRLEEISRTDSASPSQAFHLEIRSPNNVRPSGPVYFSRIAIYSGGELAAELPFDSGVDPGENESHFETLGSNWGPHGVWEGRPARPMLNFGTPFQKVGVVLQLKPGADVGAGPLDVVIQLWRSADCDLIVRAFNGAGRFDLGALPSGSGCWIEHRVTWSPSESKSISAAESFLEDVSLSGTQGTGLFKIVDVSIEDREGRETHMVSHGAPVTFRIHYLLQDATFRGRAQVLVAFQRDGVLDVCRFLTRDLEFDGSRPSGAIRLHVPRLGLANGTYAITVMIVRDGYFDRVQALFYSINPDVYVSAGRIVEFVVSDGGVVGSGTGVVAEGEWSLE